MQSDRVLFEHTPSIPNPFPHVAYGGGQGNGCGREFADSVVCGNVIQ
jgi:hypothetical protein